MTPKEKAKELVDKFARIDGYQDSIDLSKCEYEKQCTLIAVDEIIPIVASYEDALSLSQKSDELEYWQYVKSEIEKL